MVKNLNTIEKSERIRIGKHVPDEQAVNTIIINASSNVIHAPEAGLYISPIRLNNSLYSNVICYDVTTKEVIDSGIGLNLQGVTETGNSTTETLQFMNTTTSFITASNVGIANTNPQHELSVGGDTYIAGNLTVVGQTTSISTENLRVKDAIIELGENNTDDDFVFDLGLIMTRPGSNVTASYIESSNEYIIGYTQNSASDTFITPDTSNLIQMRVYGDVTANSFIGDGSLLSNVVQDTDLSANLDVIRSEMAANTIQLREDLQSNASILRDEMTANTIQLREDLQSNANILRDEMTANTIQLREDLQSNASILRDEMTANTIQLREDLQSNANILRDEMTANTIQLREDLQSNANILRDEMTANTIQLREDLQSNASILRDEMTANTIQLREDLQSNANILRDEMTANTIQLREDLQSNASILRDEMTANTIQLREDLQSNASILRDEMTANTIQLREDLQSNASILRDEMTANTIQLREDLQSNASILRDEMTANTIQLREDLQSNASILRDEMTANTIQLREDLQSNASILRDEMAANTVTIRGEMASNTLQLRTDLQSNATILRSEMAANTITIRGEMTANTLQLRTDLQSNVSTLRGEMAANTISIREEMQSNLALKANIESPVFTGIITGDGGGISNISLQHVTEYGDSTDRTITMSNALSMVTSGTVGINTPTPQRMLHVAGDILADDDIIGVDFYGDDATFTGGLTVSKDTLIYGNLEVRGNTTYLSTQNLLVEDPILALGANNTSSSLDTGLIILVYQGNSNVAFGYRGASNEFIISHTLSSPDDSELIPDTSNAINVHVYGNVTADYFIGDGSLLSNIASNLHQIALNGNITSETIILDGAETGLSVTNNVLVGGNVSISHALDVGSNVVIDDLSNDVIVATGNVLVSHALDVGSNVVINDLATDAIDVTGNIRVSDTLTSEDVTSNTVHANTYYGDGGILSNVTLQVVTDKGNTTSNTLQFTNSHTAFTTDLTSNVEVKLDQLSNVVITSPQADHLLMYDGSNWVNDYNLHNFIKVHNTTGSTLYRGNTVYIVDSFNNNVANVGLAKSDSSSTMPAIGLIHENIANGEEGTAVAYGKVNGINTTGFVEGQTVYVSNVGAGLVMNSKPYGLTDQIQNVGICIKVHQSNGVIFVTGVGRSNDIPNAPISSSPNYVYVNETNNDMKKIAPSNLLTKLQTLEQVVNTGNTVSNSINVTGLTTIGNVNVGSNISVDGLTMGYIPITGSGNYLVDSNIQSDNGNVVISTDTQINGNLYV